MSESKKEVKKEVTKKKKKRSPDQLKKNYFDEVVESSVVKYLTTEDLAMKNVIFRKELEYPFYKLVEGIINKYQLYSKYWSFDDLHKDTLSFLISKMDRFDPTLGYKAYSYYGTIVVRRLRYIQKEEQERQKKHITYDDSFQEDERFAYQIDDNTQDDLMIQSFKNIVLEITLVLEENNKVKILKEEERKVGVAILEIMSNWEKILSEEDRGANKKYEKNKILMCLRDITGFSTKDIRKYSKRYKKLYYECKKRLLEE